MADREKLTTADVLRNLTGGEPSPGETGEFPLTYRAVEQQPTPEGVEQTVRMVEIHRQIHEAAQQATPLVGADQPLPTPNRHPVIQDLVAADLAARRAIGIQRYGTPLQPFNGRDPLRDLYEELIDAVQYVRQVIYERDGR